MPNFGRPDGDINDDRIQHILTEASSMITGPINKHQQHPALSHSQHSIGMNPMNNNEESHDMEDSKSPHQQCLSPFSKEALRQKFKKYEHDDISQEKVTKIYQEELTKLMARPPRDSFPG
jgi:homeobox protein cut-like